MRLSVVVPVRNDAVRLARCLASLGTGSAVPDAIVVADNGSTDNSPEVARTAGARVLSLPGLKVSALRNAAARETTSELVAFVDADHELASGWTAAAVDTMRDETVGAAGARYLVPADGTWVQKMYGLLRGRTIGIDETDWLGSGNMVVRRKAFDQIGGFDASLEACEDVDLCRRLREAGFRIIGDERLLSVHHGDPPTLGALFRAERWRGRDNLRVSLRGSVTWRDLPSIVMPLLTLIGLLAVAASPLLGRLVGLPAELIAFASIAMILGLVAIRAAKIAAGLKRLTPMLLVQAFSIAFVYDLGRACALLTQAPHHRQ
jgi:hypothetical protein